MEAAAQSGEEMRSLRAAAGLCLASPVACCVVLTDGRIHVFNQPYRALLSTSDALATFVAGWEASLAPAFAAAVAGASALIHAHPVSDKTRDVTLSLIPVRAETSGPVAGVLVLAGESEPKSGARDLDAFRYTLAHDLLAPLRTMQEVARVLQREHTEHLPPDASILLSHLEQGTNRLVDRVDALVRLVRLSVQPLDCRTVDISHLVHDVVKELRATHGDVAAVVVGELPDAHADADLVRSLFGSLLSNAFKFSRNVPAPRIEIGSEPAQGMNSYFVMDNGAGFDMKYAGKLFGLFQRMHSEAQFEGTGAGLAIARRIVERHGGTIRAEATKDQGAKLSFTLPSASASARPGA